MLPEAISDLLQEVWGEAGEQEEVKVIWAVAQRAGVLLDGQLEYLLQKALMLLAIIRQPSTGGRSPLQLKGAATVVLRAVHSIYQHQVCPFYAMRYTGDVVISVKVRRCLNPDIKIAEYYAMYCMLGRQQPRLDDRCQANGRA